MAVQKCRKYSKNYDIEYRGNIQDKSKNTPPE